MNPNKTILVVEDDDMLRTIMVEQLSSVCNVLSSAEGKDAWEKLQKFKIDLVILDLLLPGISGYDLLRQLRALPFPEVANTPVIIVSNLRDEAHMQLVMPYHIEEYFTKSDVSLKVLTNRVERVFREQEEKAKLNQG